MSMLSLQQIYSVPSDSFRLHKVKFQIFHLVFQKASISETDKANDAIKELYWLGDAPTWIADAVNLFEYSRLLPLRQKKLKIKSPDTAETSVKSNRWNFAVEYIDLILLKHNISAKAPYFNGYNAATLS